jgi:hypothetical protein
MDVADILYFGLLAGVTLASTGVLLGQFLRGDFAGRGEMTHRHYAGVARPRRSAGAPRPSAHRGGSAAPRALAR